MIPILLLFISYFSLYQADNGGYPCEHKKLSPETNLCIMEIPKSPSKRSSPCMLIGELFEDRMDDDRYMKFQSQLKDYAKSFNKEFYVGMTKDLGYNSKKWIFENNEGFIEEEDYPFWSEKPSNKECAMLPAASDDSKVIPVDCKRPRFGLCEKKEEGCYYTPNMRYVEYFGRCLSQTSEAVFYSRVKEFCIDGYFMPIKDEKDLEAAETALYIGDTAVYAGLQKRDGRWIYERTGVEETERLENVGNRECAFYGLKRNGELTLFTADCKTKTEVSRLCAGKVCVGRKLSPETNLCILSVPKSPEGQSKSCKQFEWELFAKRMDDERYKLFQNQLLEFAKASSDLRVFIGMKKDSGFKSKKWIFENDEGSVEQDDYPFWAEKPKGNQDCATMPAASDDSKVIPEACKRLRFGLCEKQDEGCYYTKDMRYMEYFGRCLSYTSKEGDYAKVQNEFCTDGYLMPIKDEKDMEAAEAALYISCTAIYAGLRKIDGKWIYEETGVEETERLENIGDRECAFYGMKRNGELTLFTADCETKAGALCVGKAGEQASSTAIPKKTNSRIKNK